MQRTIKLFLFLLITAPVFAQDLPIMHEVTMNFVIGNDTITKELFTHNKPVHGTYDDDPVGKKTIYQDDRLTELDQIQGLRRIYMDGYRILSFKTFAVARGLGSTCTGGHSSFCSGCYWHFDYPTERKTIYLSNLRIENISSGEIFQCPNFRIYAPRWEKDKVNHLSRTLNAWLEEKQSSHFEEKLSFKLKERAKDCFIVTVSSAKRKGWLTSYGGISDLVIDVCDAKTGQNIHYLNESASDYNDLTKKMNKLLGLVLGR